MGLRSLLKRVTDKFSGEYSAAQADIRPDDRPAVKDGAEVKVTRARLNRPREQSEGVAGDDAAARSGKGS